MIGTHRFIYSLDTYNDAEPAIRYDAKQVGTTWDQLHQREEA
jgi:hypothetical protein